MPKVMNEQIAQNIENQDDVYRGVQRSGKTTNVYGLIDVKAGIVNKQPEGEDNDKINQAETFDNFQVRKNIVGTKCCSVRGFDRGKQVNLHSDSIIVA